MAKINAFRTQKGWIEVICGPMFSGKSEELLRRIGLLKFAEVKHLLFTPVKDVRSGTKAKSRDGRTFDAIAVNSAREIIDEINKYPEEVQVIAIDEAQFFDEELPDVCNYLANNDYIVIAAGLDMDSWGRPFNSMMKLLVYAERVTKLKAICTNCGASASFTAHIKPRPLDAQILVGDKNEYTALCRHCHNSSKLNYNNFPKIKKAKV
ncbi:MAG: thymidine kinase [Mycoplasmoidaceae bacterium]|nr:thymidine kinase [Mycoplasmoidaceae bacterium]